MEDLTSAIRGVIGDDPNVAEIRMFGGLCFTLNGNMLVGKMKSDDLLVRVGESQDALALARPGAAPMRMGGRTMKGFVTVDGATLDDAALREWIAMATTYVGALPPKEKTAKKSK